MCWDKSFQTVSNYKCLFSNAGTRDAYAMREKELVEPSPPAHKMAEIIIYIHYLIHTMCKGIQNFITNLNITRKEKKPEVQSMPRTQLGASRDGSRGDGTSTGMSVRGG